MTQFPTRAWIAAAAAVAAIGTGTVVAQTTAAPAAVAQSATPSDAQVTDQKRGHGRHGRHAMRDGAARPGHGQALWQHMDTDQDGQISRAEFDQAAQAAYARRMQMFDQADTNNDGLLSQEEMQAWREKMRTQMSERGHRRGSPGAHGGSGVSGSTAPAQPGTAG